MPCSLMSSPFSSSSGETRRKPTARIRLNRASIVQNELRKALPADHADQAFYAGKIAAAKHFARNVLPGVEDKGRLMAEGDATALELDVASF